MLLAFCSSYKNRLISMTATKGLGNCVVNYSGFHGYRSTYIYKENKVTDNDCEKYLVANSIMIDKYTYKLSNKIKYLESRYEVSIIFSNLTKNFNIIDANSFITYINGDAIQFYFKDY